MTGWWMYADGSVYYGIGLWRHGVELPKAIPEAWARAARDCAEIAAMLARQRVPDLVHAA